MKYINTNDTEHSITLEPRFYPVNETVSIELIDYNTKSTTFTGVAVTTSGVTKLGFTFTSKEDYIYQMIVSDDTNTVMYVGSLKSVDNE